jgi:hypothetical protein
MILKSIFLYPDLAEFSARRDDLALVKDQTRHIGHYLGRKLADLKYQTVGFDRVCVIGKKNPQETYVNSSSVLSVYVPFDMDQCRQLPREKLSDYYAALYVSGLKEAAAKHRLPITEMLAWLQELKQDNYRNEWLHKEKTFKTYGVKCALSCSMTLDKFALTLSVSKNGVRCFDKVILTTPPDEVAFHYKFKDLLVEDGQIIVTTSLKSETERVLFKMPVP